LALAWVITQDQNETMKYAYTRGSTADQNPALQLAADLSEIPFFITLKLLPPT
jgi:hypothetical protein